MTFTTSTELLEIFSVTKRKTWKSQTITTFLTRLIDKGLLYSEKQGRSNVYYASMTHEQYKQLEAQKMLEGLYGGSIKNFLAALYSGNKLKKEEIAELKKWFSDK